MSSLQARILVVDDSAVVRGLLTRSLESDPAVKVAGTASNGERALSWLEHNEADLIVLDVEMPVLDGLETLKELKKRYPGIPVIMSSSLTYAGAETTLKALRIGAADCIGKPQSASTLESIRQLSSELLPLVRSLCECDSAAGSRIISATNGGKRAGGVGAGGRSGGVLSRRTLPQNISPRVVVIGTSTGGPNALKEVLTHLPLNFRPPILIVQHMPASFTPTLARHIELDTGRSCFEATHGMLIESGTTYVAPGDFHMRVVRKDRGFHLELDQSPPQHFCRPSVNPLFESVAECYGFWALGVMLTGMGEDGIEGTQTLYEAGARIIAQDKESSVVWGMPAAVVKHGLADAVLPLTDVADEILQSCGYKAGVTV